MPGVIQSTTVPVNDRGVVIDFTYTPGTFQQPSGTSTLLGVPILLHSFSAILTSVTGTSIQVTDQFANPLTPAITLALGQSLDFTFDVWTNGIAIAIAGPGTMIGMYSYRLAYKWTDA